MDIFFSPYELNSLKRSNRLSHLGPKAGVFLKSSVKGQDVYADYFPHIALGDVGVDEFLRNFSEQDSEYDRKILDLLKRDAEFQTLKPKRFKNHQLWTGSEELKAKVVKNKPLSPSDRSFMEILQKGLKLRLDANGMFSRASFKEFLETIPKDLRHQIDYVEDPLSDADWSELGVSVARDFIDGSPADYYIFKPNCEFYPKDHKKVIFSAYLGATLGNWHAYAELTRHGDLSLYHGLIYQGFSEEDQDLFVPQGDDEYLPDLAVVKKVYEDLAQREWIKLCSV